MGNPRITRRGLLKGGAALGSGLLTLRAEAQRDCPICEDAPEQRAGKPPAGVGLQYEERFASELASFAFVVRIVELATFIEAPEHRAQLSGRVRWPGLTDDAVIEPGGELHAFGECGAQGRERSFEARFAFVDSSGRQIDVQAEKRLSAASECDAARDLSTLRFSARAGAAAIGGGVATETCEATLSRLASLRVLGVADGDLAGADQAHHAFLDFINAECTAVYPNLPKPFGASGKLRPEEWRALTLAARVMLPEQLPARGPQVHEVVENLERFVAYADQESFAQLRQGLGALGALAPFASGHIPALKKFVLRQLQQKPHTQVKELLDSLHKVAVLGYYSHRKADAVVGYERPRVVARDRVCLPTRAQPSSRVFDIAIVGSGVAGSLLAERLSAKGKSVVILEAGPYIPETEIDDDELVWLARLEKGSGLQLANADTPYAESVRTFPVLQGACVGGGGVINNAVCFQMADAQLARWHAIGFPFSTATMRAAYREVARELQIVPVSEATGRINPSLCLLQGTFGAPQTPSVEAPPSPGFWECLVNLARGACLGCGLCNTGCGSERKRNALQVHLPRALSAERDCQLVPNARVEEIVLRRSVTGVTPRVAELRVRGPASAYAVQARQYVLSAGAIQTSALLMRSPDVMARAAHLPLGERFCVNVASPVLGFYDQVLHKHAELQLTHYYYPPDDAGYLIESLYNPPGQSAVVMPGYGQLHAKRMAQYANTSLVGAVIPTLPNGRIRLDQGRVRIEVPLAQDELGRLRRALTQIASAMLHGTGDVCPREVIAGVNGGFVMQKPEDVSHFGRWFQHFQQVALSTGHPQGGSALSDDTSISVVDAEFRLRGLANLRICDGSLFPMAAGVNPQWTIMSLAHLCAQRMNELDPA